MARPLRSSIHVDSSERGVTEQDLSRRRFLGLAAGGAAATAFLAACGSDDGTVSAPTTAPAAGQAPAKDFGGKTITTAVYARNHASSPLEWQRFAPPGLTVTPVIVTSPADISRLLVSGELDFGLMGYFNTIIEAATTGMQSKIIGMCSRQGIGLIARSDRGVRTVADPKGKRVAVPPPGVQVLALTAALDKVGLKLDRDVTAVPLPFADHSAALERGDVDAYVGTEPACTDRPGVVRPRRGCGPVPRVHRRGVAHRGSHGRQHGSRAAPARRHGAHAGHSPA